MNDVLASTLPLIGSGFMVVLLALALLWLVSALIGRLFALAATRAPDTRKDTPPPAPVIPPAHLAAIAAAVATMTDSRGRIVTVWAPAHLTGNWASEGRSDQLGSHRVRWDWAVPGPPHVEHGVAPDAEPEKNG